ncbi:hypothetical protein D3C72_1885730 [compost metagenome]
MFAQHLDAQLRGRATVEGDRLQLRQAGCQGHQVVVVTGADIAVQAARALRLRHHIPQAHAMRQQGRQTFLIGLALQIQAQHLAQQHPEPVLRMRIVLAVRQRFFAGQAAQYQQARIGVDDGIETAFADVRHGRFRR